MEHTFSDFCLAQQGCVNHVLKNIEPEDDLYPVLALESEKGVSLVGLPELASGDARGDVIARSVIPMLIKCANAYYGSLAYTAWAANASATNPGLIPPRLDPDHYEVVVVSCFRKGEETIFQGILERTPGAPPRITKWEELPNSTGRLTGYSSYIEVEAPAHG